MPDIPVLFVGDAQRSEFREARSALDAASCVVHVADGPSAEALLRDDQIAPEVIVLAQAYPSQFSHEMVDRLRRLAPLARIVGLLGSWCEGEMRTGQPWPATLRMYWHQWPAGCDQQLAHMRQGACSTWALPITATDEERLLLAAQQPTAKTGQGLIAIFSPRYEMQDWLSSACRERGYSTVWLRPPRPALVEGAAAVLFDGTDCRGEEWAALKNLATSVNPSPDAPTVPIIALLDFPRIEDQRHALSAGATAVLSKPLLVADLFWQLAHATYDLGSNPVGFSVSPVACDRKAGESTASSGRRRPG